MGELLTITAKTDGVNTSGTASLSSDVFFTNVTYIRIPKGMKAKIWFKEASGTEPTVFTLKYTHDVTVAPPSWIEVESVNLASPGVASFEKRRPIILRGITGKEAFSIDWSGQTTAAVVYLTIGVEFEED